MPTVSSSYDWILRSMRQFGLVGLSSKRQRRSVPYATELLLKSQVNYARIKRRRHA